MNEQELKLEARLLAMEYMIGHTLSRLLIMLETTDEQMDQMEAAGKATLSQTTFPDINPAMADLFSAEVQESIERLLLITRQMRDVTNAKIGK